MGDDFTYGGIFKKPDGNPLLIEASGKYKTNNAEVMAILLDLENYGNGQPTINKGHVKNTHGPFLAGTVVSDTTSPGVGSDGVYRDPWGSPYIISMDFNNDQKTRDPLYRNSKVSQRNKQTGY